MTGYRTQPNPDQPDRCPSIDPYDTLQCGRRIHDDDQCVFGGIAWKKGTPRHLSDRERADAAEAKLANVRTALMQGGQNDRARWRDAVVALDLEPTCDPWSLPCPEHGDKHWRDALDLAHRAIDRMLKGDAEVARLLDLPLPDDESLWPDYLADGLPETATARMKALADERAKAARVERYATWLDSLAPGDQHYAKGIRAALQGDDAYRECDYPEPEATVDVWAEAEAERAHAKHGPKSMESAPWTAERRLRILLEEIGEVAKEFNDADIDDREPNASKVRAELIQVAAMAGAWADVVPLVAAVEPLAICANCGRGMNPGDQMCCPSLTDSGA